MAAITNIERERRKALYEQGIKQCSACSETLPLERFRANTRSWMGLRSRCVDCDNAAKMEHQQRSPAYQVARQKKRWRDANPERSHQISKTYRDAHPLEERLRSGRLRAEKAGLPAIRITAAELLADWQRRGIDPTRCVYTGEPLEERWSIDHAVPLSVAGTPGHVVTNLVPTNRGINSTKGRRRWLDYLADRAEAARA